MPVLLESSPIGQPSTPYAAAVQAKRLDVGLLNNLSDAALIEGERQFVRLLEQAAGDLDIRCACIPCRRSRAGQPHRSGSVRSMPISPACSTGNATA